MSNSLPAAQARFQLFIINTGWHSAASEVIEENLENFKSLMAPNPVYVLDTVQSREVLLSDPQRVGSDPCLLLVDQHASGGQGASGYHGFRLSLGRTSTKAEALNLFQTFTRFIVSNQNAKNIEKEVRSKLKKEGFQNVFEVLKTVV
jgi:hypothetical protein